MIVITRKGPDEILAFNAPHLPHDLTRTERELVIEADLFSRARERSEKRRSQLRRLLGVHKGVVCAGGCGALWQAPTRP